MRRIVDVIRHDDGSKTYVYSDGSRELHLRPVTIQGRVPTAPEREEPAPNPRLSGGRTRGRGVPHPRARITTATPEAGSRSALPEERERAQAEARSTPRGSRGTDGRARVRPPAPQDEERTVVIPPPSEPARRGRNAQGRPERVYPATTPSDDALTRDLSRDLAERVRERIGSRRHLWGQEVFAIAEIRDASGTRRERVFGFNHAGRHAEQHVFDQLRARMGSGERYRGGSITMLVTQEPCGFGEVPVRPRPCRLEIRQFSRRYGVYSQVYIPINPNTVRANQSFRSFLREDHRAGRGPNVGRWEMDTWDDRPSRSGGSPPDNDSRGASRSGGERPSRAHGPRSAPTTRRRTPRIVVPPGPTQDDIDAARARSRALGELAHAGSQLRRFARALAASVRGLNGVLETASILDQVNDASELARTGQFPQQAQLRNGAQSFLQSGVAAARSAEAALPDDWVDHAQGMINEAFNRRDGETLAAVAQEIAGLQERLMDARDRLRRLQSGCDSAARSFTVAHRMYRQLMIAAAHDGIAAADYFVMWRSTTGIGDTYQRAAAHYFHALNDVERDIEILDPVMDDANRAYWQLLRESFRQEAPEVLTPDR